LPGLEDGELNSTFVKMIDLDKIGEDRFFFRATCVIDGVEQEWIAHSL
jgi:hypothetical protein